MVYMTKEEIERNYKKDLAFLKQVLKDGKDIHNGSTAIVMSRNSVAAYLQIQIWHQMIEGVENGDNVWDYLDSRETAKLSSEIDGKIKG